MTNYNIKFSKLDKYSAVIYSVSYNNPIQDIEQISADMRVRCDYSCYVLFDMLLSNGDEFNRFAEGYYDGNEIKFDSINVVEFKNKLHLKKINEYYKGNARQLNESVLSASEKYKYAKNNVQ